MCFMTCFFIWLPEKKAASLCRYPENNLFTLMEETKTYGRFEAVACEGCRFFYVRR